MSRIILAAVAGLALAASPARAQLGIPNIDAPKRAAQKAADATNANIAEQTGQAVPNRRRAAIAAAESATVQRSGPPPAAPARSGPPGIPAAPAAVSPAAAAAATAAIPPVTREVFSYDAEGHRDPFYSLILTDDLRPLLSDLRLVGVLYEASGRRSVAVFRDIQTSVQYRVGQGQTLGRMRVAAIRPKGVIFTIDEFGLSRQDSLMLTDTTKVRIR